VENVTTCPPVAPPQAGSTSPVTPTDAATYGPTNGPPAPTGAAPSGLTGSLVTSAIARARFRRPLPVSRFGVGSALRASRPTITPLDASGETAFINAAAPATAAAEADVPVIVS
jgi:hypothetical protein